MASPTTTQLDSETQLTALRAWAAGRTDAPFQGRLGGPVRTSVPAGAEVETDVPASTQVSVAVQATPSSAAGAGTGWFDHDPPPFPVVRMTPRPVRNEPSVFEVVPTAVHATPGTLGAVGAPGLGAPGLGALGVLVPVVDAGDPVAVALETAPAVVGGLLPEPAGVPPGFGALLPE